VPRPEELYKPLAASSEIVHSSGFIAEPCTYFETLQPARPTGKPPVVMIHGGAHTGSCYLVTPDGRPGWAYSFLAAGYPVILPDWPGTGRSGFIAPDSHGGEIVCDGLGQVIAAAGEPVIAMTHSMAGALGWKILEKYGSHIAKLVAIAPGPPGNIQPIAEVIGETPGKFEIGGKVSYLLDRRAPFVSTPDFIDRKIIGAGTRFPREHAKSYAASLVPIPSRLVQQRLNISGSQLRVSNFANYKDKPVLVVTGSDDIDHPREVDESVVDWLNESGANAVHVFLPDRNIDGNGHMMMLEENSDEIAAILIDWIEG
jgi:pimeloyl-ACP methyl ester carboxylesterase